jgi:hypothetical protein
MTNITKFMNNNSAPERKKPKNTRPKTKRKNKKSGKREKRLKKDIGTALSTGIGVAQEMGSLGMKVGKTTINEVGKVGSKILTKKKSKKKSKKLSKKSSYRSYLSKRLKEVKKAHPSWPQSKVFKEAVKGWKSSK